MELIIKIPDKVYHRIKSDNGHGYCTLRDQDERVIVNAICSSILLAKGHGNIVDANYIKGIAGLDIDGWACIPVIVSADKETNGVSNNLPSCNSCTHNGTWDCIKCKGLTSMRGG